MVASWGDHGPRCTRRPFSPGPPVEKRQRSAFSPPARSCQKGFAVKQAYLFQLDTISLPARDVEYCWKAALCLPARLSLTEQSKKPTYIAEIFRPTCALPLHPLSKSRVWKWMCSFPPVKGKHVFLCLKKKQPPRAKTCLYCFVFSSTVGNKIWAFCTRTCRLA